MNKIHQIKTKWFGNERLGNVSKKQRLIIFCAKIFTEYDFHKITLNDWGLGIYSSQMKQF